MILLNPPRMVKYIYPDVIWRIPTNEKVIYLTIDDGPTVDITFKILEILKQYQARATFFCIGRNVERDPDILKTIVESGHAVGNHTYSHIKGWRTKNADYYADIELAAQFIPSRLLRPAYGQIKPAQARYLHQHYNIIMWSVLSYDYNPNLNKKKCLKQVLRHTKPGSIVVFHDSIKASKNMLYALPRMLDHFSELGYSFKNLETKKF